MSVAIRFRDALRALTQTIPFLSDRKSNRKTASFRLLWGMVSLLDPAVEQLTQGIFSWFPGLGTPTAFPIMARSRQLLRWQDESAEDFAARLRAWLDTHDQQATELEIAKQIHGYLRSKPRVRIVTRGGRWTTVNEDGSVERHAATWDWDSVSHPERNDPDEPWWSDRWIIVYTTAQLPLRPGLLGDLTGDDGSALGHMVTHQEVDALMGLLWQFKGAHTCTRAVIFTTDATLFDPDVPATCPDGTWGAWSTRGSGSRVASGRDVATCRYWEPR